MTSLQKLHAYLDGTTVAREVFELRPDYRVLLLAIEGIAPRPSDEFSNSLLAEAEESVKTRLRSTPVNDLPHVSAWRAAYKSFGTNPKKTRNSLEALTRRAEKGLPRVNRLTDIYNAISVKHQIPFGGEDLDKYTSSPFLIRATGTEKFEVKSEGKIDTEHPGIGEVIWCDSTGVTCRHWNWRQTYRTALSERTTKVLFIMDGLEPCTSQDLEAAAGELIEALKKSSPDIIVAKRLIGKVD